MLECDIPVHLSSPLAKLRLLLRQVQLHHDGELLLEVHHSNLISSDAAIEALSNGMWENVYNIFLVTKTNFRQNFNNTLTKPQPVVELLEWRLDSFLEHLLFTRLCPVRLCGVRLLPKILAKKIYMLVYKNTYIFRTVGKSKRDCWKVLVWIVFNIE